MNFYQRAQDRAIGQGGTRCRLAVLFDTLPDDYTASVQEAFTDPTIGPTTIKHLLEEDGHIVSLNTVARHRRGECQCPTS